MTADNLLRCPVPLLHGRQSTNGRRRAPYLCTCVVPANPVHSHTRARAGRMYSVQPTAQASPVRFVRRSSSTLCSPPPELPRCSKLLAARSAVLETPGLPPLSPLTNKAAAMFDLPM